MKFKCWGSVDPESKTSCANKTKIAFVDLHWPRGEEYGIRTRRVNSDGRVQTFFLKCFSLNIFLSIICSVDFLLNRNSRLSIKLLLSNVKKCTCHWSVTSPVLYPHLSPGPFSMARTTRAARHGPKISGSIWKRALSWWEASKWPLGYFPGKPWGGQALSACQGTAGETPASCAGEVPGTTGALPARA